MKKLVKRKQTDKEPTETTQNPLMPLKKTRQENPKKQTHLKNKTGNTENYRRVPKQRLEPCSCGLTMVN